jgi:hypothetical protein
VEGINKFAPVVQLDYMDRADLAAMVATPGWKVLHRIMRGEVDKFVLALINTKIGSDDKEEVYNKFLLSKAAAQFYQQVADRVNEETLQYIASKDNTGPIDSTEGILDIGEQSNPLEEEGII